MLLILLIILVGIILAVKTENKERNERRLEFYGMIEFNCPFCYTGLEGKGDYIGILTCPECYNEFNVNKGIVTRI